MSMEEIYVVAWYLTPFWVILFLLHIILLFNFFDMKAARNYMKEDRKRR